MTKEQRRIETLMKETPNDNRNSAPGANARKNAPYKYTYEDVDCQYCKDKKSCNGENLCPYIVENIDDLLDDEDFIRAVEKRAHCKTKHKVTLDWVWEEHFGI